MGAALGAAAAVGAAAFAWGSLVERNRFTIRHETVSVLEPGARPLTVLHVADLHMAPWQSAKQEWVRSLALLEPDLIVNTGDNLGHPDGIEGVIEALAPFAGVPGVFVHGSNDYFGPQLKNPFSYFGGPSSRPAAAAWASRRRQASMIARFSTRSTRPLNVPSMPIGRYRTPDARRGASGAVILLSSGPAPGPVHAQPSLRPPST